MDVEQTIAFLLEQQSRFAEQQCRFAEHQSRLAKEQSWFAEQQRQFVTDLAELRAVVLDLANAQARTNQIVATLAERQVSTEENLNALISTVERHIASHK